MAKKKAAAKTTKNLTAGTTTKSSSGKSTTKKKPAGKSTGAQLPSAKSNSQPLGFSNAQIGQTAGEVWQSLCGKNGQTIAALKKNIAAPNDMVAAAIGWLAREDKLQFEASGRTVKVSLR